MKRKIVNTLVFVSLMLAITTALLWRRSYAVGEMIVHDTITFDGQAYHTWRWDLLSGRGDLRFSYHRWGPALPANLWTNRPPPNPADSGWTYRSYENPGSPNLWSAPQSLGNRMGFYLSHTTEVNYAPASYTIVAAPFWAIMLLFLIAPVVWFVFPLKHWRGGFNPYGCPNCGYDLRATRDRCPECGAVPAEVR